MAKGDAIGSSAGLLSQMPINNGLSGNMQQMPKMGMNQMNTNQNIQTPNPNNNPIAQGDPNNMQQYTGQYASSSSVPPAGMQSMGVLGSLANNPMQQAQQPMQNLYRMFRPQVQPGRMY